jgi:hypothetical protein
MRQIQLDIFRWTAHIIEDNGRQKKYFIEFKDGFYCLFVQRKKGKGAKWSRPMIIEKSKQVLVIDFDASSEVGLKSVIVA